MEWVETTGKTVEEAKDAALDQLGVDEQDAEFEVVEEPRAGLFGRMRGEARVRARVRPTQVRPKLERRERRPKGAGRGRGDRSPRDSAPKTRGAAAPEPAAAAVPQTAEAPVATAATEVQPLEGARPAAARAAKSRGSAGRRQPNRTTDDHDDEESTPMSDTELVEQGEVVRGFLVDLLDAFGLDGEVAASPTEDGAVALDVTGEDLGLLIGPKGATLQAIQELSRSVLQRQLPGESHARIRVDVSGYRARRKVALEGFVRQLAGEVRTSGVQKVLEPMSPPDRKVVHDTVNDIEGVHTMSEGEDARRRVVILPDA